MAEKVDASLLKSDGLAREGSNPSAHTINKEDNRIKKLFNQGYGARTIAYKLGYDYPASITKKLKRLELIRKKNEHLRSEDKLHVPMKPNKKKLHKAAEYELMRICSLCDLSISIPDSEAPYDLLVLINRNIKKIQVKSSYSINESGNYIFTLTRTRSNTKRSVRRKYLRDEIDYFFLHDWDGNSWLIPYELLYNQRTIVPALRFPGFKVQL